LCCARDTTRLEATQHTQRRPQTMFELFINVTLITMFVLIPIIIVGAIIDAAISGLRDRSNRA